MPRHAAAYTAKPRIWCSEHLPVYSPAFGRTYCIYPPGMARLSSPEFSGYIPLYKPANSHTFQYYLGLK